MKLYVYIPRRGTVEKDVKEVEFPPSMRVQDALESLRSTYDLEDDSDAIRYGLFMMSDDEQTRQLTEEEKFERGWWLNDESQLDNYLLKVGDSILVKNKIRLLYVSTLDHTKKAHRIDDSHDVKRIVNTVCNKLSIKNPEEYSFCEDPHWDEDNVDGMDGTLTTLGRATLGYSTMKSGMGTMKGSTMRGNQTLRPGETSTLKKKKLKDQVGEKLEKMANKKYRTYERKLFTDAKIKWLKPSETLRQQDIIHPLQPVMLRRKFFYADANVEEHDPVQLNLLYEQCRDSIVKEEYPVTRRKAAELAGIQSTILHGKYVKGETNTKLDLDNMFPACHVKKDRKTTLKEVQAEWENQSNNHEKVDVHHMKHLYVSICRKLETYGITCFLVKEKEPGRNRMVPRLLGISKTSVYRLDNDTKEILKEWKLESIKRWAAGPKNATLDFGEYQTEPYAVKTQVGEGEKIVQLISGYIDIIMAKRAGADKFDQQGQEGATCVMYQNQPKKPHIVRIGANANQNLIQSGQPIRPGIMHHNSQAQEAIQSQFDSKKNIQHIDRPVQQPMRPHLLPFQTTIKDNIDRLDNVRDNLKGTLNAPSHTDPDWLRDQKLMKSHQIESTIAQTAAHTAELVNKFPSEERLNSDQLPLAVNGLVQQIKQLPVPIKDFAALHLDEPDKSDGIINAADQLINSLTDMLKSAQVEESDSLLDAKRKIQNAAHEVSSALENILTFVNDGSENGAYKLVELASHVAHATSDLVNRVKTIASRSDRLDEPDSPEKALVMAATRSANAATQLVAVARITAPTIYDPACQQQLADAMKDVSMAIKQIFPHDMDKSWLESSDLDALRDATGRVSDALAALIGHMKRGVSPSKATKYDELLMATQQLSGISDREELIQCVRSISTIAIGPQGLVHALNADADDAQSQARRDRLNMAVRSVMAATASVVEAAKSVAERQNAASKEKLAAAAGELGQATENAVRLQQKKEALQNLLDAVKQAAGAATQFVAPAKVSIQFNTNPNTANQLNIENQALKKHVPSIIRAARDCTEQPDSSTNQQALIKTAEDFAAAAHRTIGASRTAQPTIEDHNAKLMLKGATDKLAAALNALQTATHAAGEVFESSPLETACDMVASAREDLKKMEEQAAKGQLRANPGDDRQAAAQQLSTQVKTTCSVVPQLLTCAAQTDDSALNSAAMSAANAVQGLKEAVRSSAATGARDEQLCTVQAGSAVVGSIHELLLNARDGMNARDSAGNRQKLYGVAKDLTLALNDMLNCLPGQKEIETSMQRVKKAQERQKQFNEGAISSKGNFHDAAESLKIAAEDTNQAAGNLVGASRGEVRDIVLASSELANDYDSLVDAGLNVAAHTAPGPDRQDVLHEMSQVAKASNKLLFASKEIACDLANPGYRQNLQQAAKELTDAINDLITKCTAAAPGQASCDAALRQLNQSRDQLNMFAPVEGKDDYFTILDQIITVHSKRLGDAMTGMYQYTRESNLDAFNREVGAAAKTLVALAEDAGSAAYIVGISDPASIPGRGGLLNQSEFVAASEQIQQAIRDLQDGSCAQDRLVHAVTIVAKQTGQLCNLCRAAKERAQRPEQRKQFMHAAKDLANATTELVAKIKAYGQTQSPDNRQAVNDATIPLDQSTRSLLAFSQSPEFAPVQPILSEHAKLAQAPITGAADSMLAGGVEMISTLKKLVANPTNHAEWSSLTGSSKKVSESIKQMIQSIRESAPGQSECDAAIDMVNKSLRTLNDASIDALGNSLERCTGDLANHVDNLVAVLAEIDAVTGPLSQAACQDATQLGSRVTQTGQFSSPLASSTIAVASLSAPSSRQVDLIDHAKTVGEALLQLVYAAKEAGGNRNIESAHESVHESVDMVRDAVHEFRAMLNESPEAATSSLIAAVEQSQQKLDQGKPG